MMKQEHFYHQAIGITNRTIKNVKIEMLLYFNHLINCLEIITYDVSSNNCTLGSSKTIQFLRNMVIL